jgi:GNAT superfamily N-acetyltransferase
LADLSALELMRVHLDALYTYDAEGRMSHVNEARGPRAPRVFLGRTPAGHEMRSRADVPESTLASIRELVTREPSALPLAQRPHCGEAIVALLERDDAVVRVWSGPAYRIEVDALPVSPMVVRVTRVNADLLRTFPDWRDEVDERQPFMVAVENGSAVALCSSVRITGAAHAAGVETLPAARRRGLASQVVAAWARAVAELGAIPLYSTSWDNVASQAVARRLGMPLIGVDFHVT